MTDFFGGDTSSAFYIEMYEKAKATTAYKDPNYKQVINECRKYVSRGVYIGVDNILFDNEWMDGKVSASDIEYLKQLHFTTIYVGYQKMFIGTILQDIASNFTSPKVLDLDLFYASFIGDRLLSSEDYEENEVTIREIFKAWKGKDVKVIFRCNEIIIKEFTL